MPSSSERWLKMQMGEWSVILVNRHRIGQFLEDFYWFKSEPDCLPSNDWVPNFSLYFFMGWLWIPSRLFSYGFWENEKLFRLAGQSSGS